MIKMNRTLFRVAGIALSLTILFAGAAFAKEKKKVKTGDFDFAKTDAFMREIETRPDFPYSTVIANDYVTSLRALGDKIDNSRQNAIIAYLKLAQKDDGGFISDKFNKGASIIFTDLALETLALLDASNAVNTGKVKTFVASLKNPDGGFGFSQESKGSSLVTTYYAIHVLKRINGLDLIDKPKTIEYVRGFEKKGGGFGMKKGPGDASPQYTYMAAYILNTLGSLDTATRNNAIRFIATTPYGGNKAKATPDLNEQLYAIRALKELKAPEKIDRKYAMAFMKRLYIKVNGGFGPLEGYGSTPESTTAGLRVLAELDKLKGVHVAGIPQRVGNTKPSSMSRHPAMQ
jgi:hypothetical protein